jgi:integrase
MPLSDTACRNAKPGPSPAKLADGGGLYLFVSPQGAKLWRMDYRYLGKRRTASLGAYPAVGLAVARKLRDGIKGQLAEGLDPAAAKRAAAVAATVAAENTFRAIADEYQAKLKREGRAVRTLEKIRWLLDFADSVIGRRPISTITPAEVLEVLRRVEKRGRHETARRLRSTIGSVFRYAIATARAENDPTIALRGALTTPTVTPRAAVTDEKQLGALLRAIDGYGGQPSTHAALRLMPILFPRPGELRAADWAEFDLDAAVWTVPAARTKMRRPHRVPLPGQAVAILRELHAITGRGKLAFPSVRTVLRPISENTLNAALRRMGYAQDEVTSHGFRATASTLLNESGLWNPDAIERQLAHVEGNAVRRAYARGEHWDERVRMMQWWADRLDGLRGAS